MRIDISIIMDVLRQCPLASLERLLPRECGRRQN